MEQEMAFSDWSNSSPATLKNGCRRESSEVAKTEARSHLSIASLAFAKT